MSTEDRLLDQPGRPEVVLAPSGRMTEEQFVAWCDEDTRAEWVDGEVIAMVPPGLEHSDLGTWLAALLRIFVEERGLGAIYCEVQVRLPGQRRRVPDILFLSKERKHLARQNHVEGPPDLVVEIVSPDSLARDWREKYLEYEAAGVREYWVIDPMSERMEVYALEGPPAAEAAPASAYRRLEEKDGWIASSVLTGFTLRPAWLWPQTRPTLMAALRELGLISSGGQ